MYCLISNYPLSKIIFQTHGVMFCFVSSETTEPQHKNGSCSNSCCTSSEYSCNAEGCYCDSDCVSNGNCCDDYQDVCPSLNSSIGIHILPSFFHLFFYLLLGENILPISKWISYISAIQFIWCHIFKRDLLRTKRSTSFGGYKSHNMY